MTTATHVRGGEGSGIDPDGRPRSASGDGART